MWYNSCHSELGQSKRDLMGKVQASSVEQLWESSMVQGCTVTPKRTVGSKKNERGEG